MLFRQSKQAKVVSLLRTENMVMSPQHVWSKECEKALLPLLLITLFMQAWHCVPQTVLAA